MAPIDTAELRRAFDQRAFFHAYQPIVELDAMNVVHVEALLRWEHPTLGRLAPGSFLSLVHWLDLSDTLTDFGLELVLEDLPKLREKYGADVGVAINLSHAQLRDPLRTVDRIEAALEAWGVDPTVLVVEVVEDLPRRDIARTRGAFVRLQEMGVSVVLDDFGTGASSLTALTDMVYEGLKIDRSFVRDLPNSTVARSVVESVLEFGRRTGRSVIAEGVERLTELQALQDLGCDLAQGYLLGRPRAVSEEPATLHTDLVSEPASVAEPKPGEIEALRVRVNAVDPRAIGSFDEVRNELEVLHQRASAFGASGAKLCCEIGRQMVLASIYAADSGELTSWALRTSQVAESIGEWEYSAEVLAMYANVIDEPRDRQGMRVTSLIRALEIRLSRPLDPDKASAVDNAIGSAFGNFGLWSNADQWWKDSLDRHGAGKFAGSAMCAFNLCELHLYRLEGGFWEPENTPRELSLALVDQTLASVSANPSASENLVRAFAARLHVVRGDVERARTELEGATESTNLLDVFQLLRSRAHLAKTLEDAKAFFGFTSSLTELLEGVSVLAHHEHRARLLHVEALRAVGRKDAALSLLTELHDQHHRQDADRLITLFDWVRTNLDHHARLRELPDVESTARNI